MAEIYTHPWGNGSRYRPLFRASCFNCLHEQLMWDVVSEVTLVTFELISHVQRHHWTLMIYVLQKLALPWQNGSHYRSSSFQSWQLQLPTWVINARCNQLSYTCDLWIDRVMLRDIGHQMVATYRPLFRAGSFNCLHWQLMRDVASEVTLVTFELIGSCSETPVINALVGSYPKKAIFSHKEEGRGACITVM